MQLSLIHIYTQPMYQTNVSLRGGGERIKYYSSLGYMKQNGCLLYTSNAQLNAGELFVNANTNVINQLFDVDYFRNKYLGEHGGIARTSYGDQYGSVPSSAKNYFFKVDNYDYVRKETVIRPQ